MTSCWQLVVISLDSGLQPEGVDHMSFSPQCPTSDSECRKETLTPGATLGRDTNKIRFDFTRDAFKLLYFDGDSLKRTTKGFEVPRTDAMRLVLCRDD